MILYRFETNNNFDTIVLILYCDIMLLMIIFSSQAKEQALSEASVYRQQVEEHLQQTLSDRDETATEARLQQLQLDNQNQVSLKRIDNVIYKK